MRDGTETDIDCGGGTCSLCGVGSGCMIAATDCAATYCHDWLCTNTPCGTGTYDNGTSCRPCDYGTSSSLTNVQGSCPSCEAGKIAAMKGLQTCTSCIKGTFANATGNHQSLSYIHIICVRP